MRVGLFGGSFDPVHYGHLLLAECCREACRLHEVWFMPAAVPPHKQQHPLADAKHRVEMLRLATAGHPAFRVSTWEIERGGISYTVETLQRMRQELPEAELYLLVGSDTLADMAHWREPATIWRLARIAVVCRSGQPLAAGAQWEELRRQVGADLFEQYPPQPVEMPLFQISSSDIRRAVACGRSIRYRTPRAVELYIQQHGLYQTSSGDHRVT
ncbi:MAG: putative nicotinate-nucleotide adenylyltransferase [Pirellulaceae bacterium]|nr:MAG: putative nicotinate-nucleotide adenylyltransferase [Pirellulaceae bacterium]